MFSLIKNVALDYGPPKPGCEYEFKPDPTWGQVPVGQICGSSKQSYLIIGIVFGIVLIISIAFILFRRSKRKSSLK